jgi:GTPase SAR1 family protein
MPPLTSYFVMRKEPWEKMKRGLIDDDTEEEEQKIMVISGMGGCGKTQLVIRFTKEFKRRSVDISNSKAYLIRFQIQIRILRRREHEGEHPSGHHQSCPNSEYCVLSGHVPRSHELLL